MGEEKDCAWEKRGGAAAVSSITIGWMKVTVSIGIRMCYLHVTCSFYNFSWRIYIYVLVHIIEEPFMSRCNAPCLSSAFYLVLLSFSPHVPFYCGMLVFFCLEADHHFTIL